MTRPAAPQKQDEKKQPALSFAKTPHGNFASAM